MGYRRERRLFNLKFEDPEYAGLEVLIRTLPVGEFLGLARLQASLDTENPDISAVEKLFKVFLDKLIRWNVEDPDSGEPVPTTMAGLQTLELDFVLVIIGAWVNGMAGVSPSLGKDSPSGGTFPEVDVPTEAWSGSLPS